MREKKWKRRPGSGDFWDPEPGEELVGKLENIRMGDWNKNVYDLRVDKEIIVVPSSAVLDRQITPEDLNRDIKIKFVGWRQGKKGKYRNFEVYDPGEEKT